MRVNLCFHGIGRCDAEREQGESKYWVTADVFRGILDAVGGLGHVDLSFDDGNRSDIEVAAPELVARGLRARFFALAGRLDDPLSLSPGDLRELRGMGMEIGSHGWDHIPWTGLSGGQRDRELVAAPEALAEASGGAVTMAALPLGRYDRRLVRLLRTLGYQRVYTSDRMPAWPGARFQPRYSVTSTDTVSSVLELVSWRRQARDLPRAAVVLVKRMR